MKEEFQKIADLYGISDAETNELEKRYESIENVKEALDDNSIEFLSQKDKIRLKKYLKVKEQPKQVQKQVSGKICGSCQNLLPKTLDKNICPNCGRRTG